MKNNLNFEIFKRLLLKYNSNLTDNEILNMFNNDDSVNLRNVIDFICNKHNNIKDIVISEDYKKLQLIYQKTRIREFPKLEFFEEISLELAKKFKLKTYRLFYDSHLFQNHKALINMISIFGLFEDDKEVQKRINKIVDIFFYQRIYCQRIEMKNKPNIIEKNNTLYLLDEKIRKYIPENLRPYIFDDITPEYYTFLRNMKGNFGKKINDFLSPYTSSNGIFGIKEGVKKYKEYYDYLLLNQSDTIYYPYKKDIDIYYVVDYSLPLSVIKEMLKEFKEYELTYGPSDIQSMFYNVEPVYNPKFYEFFIKHQADIVNSTNSFSKIPFVQRKYAEAIKYYSERGNDDPDYITIIEWLREVPYNVEFGDEIFAQEARNAGILKEGYEYYIHLFDYVKHRYIRVLPNHIKRYKCVGADGLEYELETRILDGNDPLNMLIGESKYTDCCQKYDDLGRSCLEHASKSLMGGILIVSLIQNGISKPLSQSWIWINEQELVLDNVEQTILLKYAPSKQQGIFEDLIALALKNAAEDIICDSNYELKKYISSEYLKIEQISDSEIKRKRLIRLKEILNRQSIKVVSIGANYSDIIVKNYFDTLAKRPLYLPKDYDKKGYSDATVRYVAAGDEKDIIVEPSEEYTEEAIYRVKRNINILILSDLSNEKIKRIIEIDKTLSNKKIKCLDDFIKLLQVSIDDNIIIGSDWYCILNQNGIVRYVLGIPRIEDEKEIQVEEFNNTVNTFLSKIDEKAYCKKLEVRK